jgi:phosphoserine phosphatase
MDKSIVIQREDIFTRVQKLIVFDVESSLIQKASIDDFAEKTKNKLTSMGKHAGFIDNDKDKIMSVIENAHLFKGIPLKEIKGLYEEIQLTHGTLQLFKILKSMGYRIALLSSCFNFLLKRIYMETGVDYAFANALMVDEDGILTGNVEDPIIDGTVKKELLDFIMKKEHIGRDQVIAVGNASTESRFISNAGLSLAFQSDDYSFPTDGILRSDNIINLLYCLGIPKTELDRYLRKE